MKATLASAIMKGIETVFPPSYPRGRLMYEAMHNLLVNWFPCVLVPSMFASVVFTFMKLAERLNRALPERDRQA